MPQPRNRPPRPAYLGVVRTSWNRQFGWASLVDTRTDEGQFDPAGGRWVTICETHATLCNHPTRALAESHLPAREWCEDCTRLVGPRGG